MRTFIAVFFITSLFAITYSYANISGGGVASLNGLTGATTIAGGAGTTVTSSGSTITIASTGPSTAVTSLNGLLNAVTLAAGSNMTVSSSGQTITLASSGGIVSNISSANSYTANESPTTRDYIYNTSGDAMWYGSQSGVASPGAVVLQPGTASGSNFEPGLYIYGGLNTNQDHGGDINISTSIDGGIAINSNTTLQLTNHGSNYIDMSPGTGQVRITKSGGVDLSLNSGAGDSKIDFEKDGVGAYYFTLQSPAALSASYTMKLPQNMGSGGQCLSTDGTDTTSWANKVSSVNSISNAAIIAGGSGITVSSASQTVTVTNAGVTSVNGSGMIGDLTIAAGSNVTVSSSGSTITIAASAGGSPGGSEGQIQYNSSAAFAASSALSFDSTGKGLIVGAPIASITTTPTKGYLYLGTNGTSSVDHGFISENIAATTSGANYTSKRARGTAASPTAISSGDTIGSLAAYGYDGSAYGTSSDAAFAIVADQTFTSAAHGTNLQLKTTKNGSAANSNHTAVKIGNDSTLTLFDSNGTNSVGLSTSTGTTSYSMVFPTAQGSSGQTISNDGSGNLSWVNNAKTVNSIQGDVTIAAGTNVTVSSSGQTVTVNAPNGASNGTAGYVQYSGGSGAFSSDSTASNQFFWDSTNHRLGLGTITPHWKVDAGGAGSSINSNFTIVGTTGIAAANSNTALYVYNDGSSRALNAYDFGGSSYLDFIIGSSNQALYVKSNGNIGIGINTSDPKQPLELGGIMRMSAQGSTTNYIDFTIPSNISAHYTTKWPVAQGSSGQTYVNDGSGNLSWANLTKTVNSILGDVTIAAGSGITVSSASQTVTVANAGVTSINGSGMTGNLTIAAGSGVTVSSSGSTITVSNSGLTSVDAGTICGHRTFYCNAFNVAVYDTDDNGNTTTNVTCKGNSITSGACSVGGPPTPTGCPTGYSGAFNEGANTTTNTFIMFCYKT